MNITTIDHLLTKYWEGETSIQEENTLKEYFSSNEIHESHKEFAPMFGYFVSEAQQGTSKDFKQGIVDNTSSKVFQLTKYIRVIAAVFALGLIAYMGYEYGVQQKKTHHTMASHEIEDPEQALLITKNALAMLSTKLSKQTNSISNDMNRVSSLDVLK